MMGTRATTALTALTLSALLPGLANALGFGDVKLRSSLNAPLDAEIGITATTEELQGLKAGIASRDSFARNGLDYPGFLSAATVTVARSSDGGDILRVRTSAPVTEPFVTMLIEVNYTRGRLLREYTVLLDPPVLGNQAMNGPISAPVTTAAAPVSAAPSPALTPAAVAVQAPPVAPTAAPMPPASGTNYRVQRGDSLSLIAARKLPGVNRPQALTGIYRANTAAFAGNMNELRAGSELRMPSAAELAALSPADANSEVASQYRSWRGAGRLRLVPPGEAAPPAAATSGTGSSGAGSATASTGLQRQVDDLQKQLADTQRLLELRNAELAQLQGQSAQQVKPPEATAPAAATPPAVAVPPAAAPSAAVQPATVPVAVPVAEPSLLDRILEQWKLLLVAVLVLLALAIVLMRRRRDALSEPQDFDRFDSSGSFGDSSSGAFEKSFEKSNSGSQTLPTRLLPIESSDSILVSESGTRPELSLGRDSDTTGDGEAQVGFDTRATLASTGTQPLLVPISGDDEDVPGLSTSDSSTALDRGDPLAEADFHMAYGLYDQAADLVKKAITTSPARRDLKLKLLEVFFVWGNKEQFLQLAHDLNGSSAAGESGEWEKIQIMGRQIAADDAMFAGKANLAGAARGSVDLNLEGGQNRVDFNIMGEPTMAPADADELDLDFGDEAGLSADTVASPRLPEDEGVDFVLDDPARGADVGDTTASAALIGMPDVTAETRQMVQGTHLQQDDGFDTSLSANTSRLPSLDAADAGTIRRKLGGQAARQGTAPAGGEQTAELSIDDLGLDLGTVEVPAATRQQPTISELGAVDLLLESSGVHGGLDVGSTTQSGELSVTGEATALTQAFDAAATSALPALSLPGDTASQPIIDGARLDSDPPTMSEVGTKLDLARAYMDMGDPDGARSILDEVLKEGSSSQKQEAQRLLASLPG